VGLGAPTAEIAANRVKSIDFRRFGLNEWLFEALAGIEDDPPQGGKAIVGDNEGREPRLCEEPKATPQSM
jgi:hypothetical protein